MPPQNDSYLLTTGHFTGNFFLGGLSGSHRLTHRVLILYTQFSPLLLSALRGTDAMRTSRGPDLSVTLYWVFFPDILIPFEVLERLDPSLFHLPPF